MAHPPEDTIPPAEGATPAKGTARATEGTAKAAPEGAAKTEPEGTAKAAPEGAAPTEDTARSPEGAAKTEAEDAAEEPPSEPDPKLLIAAAKREAEENKDKFLRATAEMENYKRRMQKEHADTMRYAMSPLIRDVAAIVDTLELAVSHAKKDPDNGGPALVDGIEMVVKQMYEVFARFGVTRIETAGKPFDPELHEAMTVVETSAVPENQVIEEFQAGFKLHERVIRPARVSVSKTPA